MSKCNDTLREYIRLHWGKMTDYAIATANDCDRVKVRNMRVSMGLRRDRKHLRAMYDAHKRGAINAGRSGNPLSRYAQRQAVSRA